MGLIAVNAVVQADSLQLSGIGQVILAAQGVGIVHQNLIYLIFVRHAEHGKVPGIKAGLGALLNSLFRADDPGNGIDLGRCFPILPFFLRPS